jgi:ABC-type transport system involved in cytochrome bd biosynthesis fused ATPase/permease subunit
VHLLARVCVAAEALASMQRLEKFLLLEEGTDAAPAPQVQVLFENAELAHGSKGTAEEHHGETSGKEVAVKTEEFKLSVPKFEVKPGEVCAIVGRVGSGE